MIVLVEICGEFPSGQLPIDDPHLTVYFICGGPGPVAESSMKLFVPNSHVDVWVSRYRTSDNIINLFIAEHESDLRGDIVVCLRNLHTLASNDYTMLWCLVKKLKTLSMTLNQYRYFSFSRTFPPCGQIAVDDMLVGQIVNSEHVNCVLFKFDPHNLCPDVFSPPLNELAIVHVPTLSDRFSTVDVPNIGWPIKQEFLYERLIRRKPPLSSGIKCVDAFWKK